MEIGRYKLQITYLCYKGINIVFDKYRHSEEVKKYPTPCQARNVKTMKNVKTPAHN